jgi:hypothetical protein
LRLMRRGRRAVVRDCSLDSHGHERAKRGPAKYVRITACTVSGVIERISAVAAEQLSGSATVYSWDICLERGTHRLTEPVKLIGAQHSHLHFRPCEQGEYEGGTSSGGDHGGGDGGGAILSGGATVVGWEPWGNGLWMVRLSGIAPRGLRHVRQLYVAGRRASRTRIPASDLFGEMEATGFGYTTSQTLPRRTTEAEHARDDLELVYGELDSRVWASPRCAVRRVRNRAKGAVLVVARPCFDRLPRNGSRAPLPARVENIPRPHNSRPGEYWFSSRSQVLWYHARPDDVSAGGANLTAEVRIPISEGLVVAEGIEDVSFTGLGFELSAWGGPHGDDGYVPAAHGNGALVSAHESAEEQSLLRATHAPIPGALTCMNCTRLKVTRCAFAHLGGAGIVLESAAQYNTVEWSAISDVSASGVQIGSTRRYQGEHEVVGNVAADDGDYSRGDDDASRGNMLTDSVIHDTAKEYTGCACTWSGTAHSLVRMARTLGCGPPDPRCGRWRSVAHGG